MPFGNPIVGGGGVLIRPAIQSPNFVHGSAGWSINKDGSSEFTAVQINGGTLVMQGSTGAIFVYAGAAGAGNLRVSISPVAGTDPYGNTYPAGICTQGTDGTKVSSWLQSVTSASVWQSFQPQNQALVPGSVSASGSGTVGTLQLSAPKPVGISDQGQISLMGGSSTGPGILLSTATFALLTGGDFRTDTGSIVDGSLPAKVVSTANSIYTITSTTYASLPTPLTVTVPNPSFSRAVKVTVHYFAWLAANGADVRAAIAATGSNVFAASTPVAGGPDGYSETLLKQNISSGALDQHSASISVIIPAGGSTTFEMQALRSAAAGTETVSQPTIRVEYERFV